jgi:hypothetical protein
MSAKSVCPVLPVDDQADELLVSSQRHERPTVSGSPLKRGRDEDLSPGAAIARARICTQVLPDVVLQPHGL